MADIRATMFPKRIIVALLCDVQTSCSEVFSARSCKADCRKVVSRLEREGIGFLTKTLPRLGKALDRALTGEASIDAASLRFEPQTNSKLPKLFGELFNSIFSHGGWILPTPCVKSIKHLRQLCFLFYKYELPYSSEQENEVIERFLRTEDEVSLSNQRIRALYIRLGLERGPDESTDSNVSDTRNHEPRSRHIGYSQCDLDQGMVYDGRGTGSETLSKDDESLSTQVVERARGLLHEVFRHFNIQDILPRHGPGCVSTKEILWDKYRWKNIPDRLTQTYPLDAYFFASLGHVCDEMEHLCSIGDVETPARVILVPKDSRGPRLISAEPHYNMWIQQGLLRAIVEHLESHPLTRWNIHFTNQQPNQFGALLGSLTGDYATLDLNEASDRVSVWLVRLLFPSSLVEALMACRSSMSQLPNGKVVELQKFAPMGSAVCFPILASCIWALLAASLVDDANARESILVYGDDIIVPTAKAADAIKLLESFGLKVNRDKSCTSGFFRESCGTDAYRGVDVTPVRLRTVWSSSHCPHVYSSWIASANHFWNRQYTRTYELIVGELVAIYGPIPDSSMDLPCPSLASLPEAYQSIRSRSSPNNTDGSNYQRREWLVWDMVTPKVHHEMSGWFMLLRWFSEAGSTPAHDLRFSWPCRCGVDSSQKEPFSVRAYTRRGEVRLRKRWIAKHKVTEPIALAFHSDARFLPDHVAMINEMMA